MAQRFFSRKFRHESAGEFMTDLESNQGVVKTTITVTPVDQYWSVAQFYNDIPVVAEADGATTTYEGGSEEPTWTDLVEVTDGDHSAPFTFDVDTSAVDMGTVGTFDVGYVATDASGNDSDLFELEITIEDTTAPVITLTATEIDIEASDVATFNPLTNMVSAIDAVDGDVSADVTLVYKEDTSSGSLLADIDAAITYLGTEGNAVYVTYDVDDAEGNSATTKSATYTAIADSE